MNERRWLLAIMFVFFASALAAPSEVIFTPAEPTQDDIVTVTVTRTFSADCLWQAEHEVLREEGVIELLLSLSGEDACDDAITKMSFDVEIGHLPAGVHELRIRWSDKNSSEVRFLTVFEPEVPAD